MFLRFTLTLLLLIPLQTKATTATEKDISAHKVAYLYYFSKFITWPISTFSQRGNINLCVGDISKNMSFQLSTIEGKRIGKYHLKTVSILKDPTNDVSDENISRAVIESCHLLYINATMLDWFQKNSSNLPQHILTVSDITSEENNSLIHLHKKDKRLHFEIKTQLTQIKSIKISSKLLKLSKERSKP